MITEHEIQRLLEVVWDESSDALAPWRYIDRDLPCPRCKYNLRGLPRRRQVRCPECGSQLDYRGLVVDGRPTMDIPPERADLCVAVLAMILVLPCVAMAAVGGVCFGLLAVPGIVVAAALARHSLKDGIGATQVIGGGVLVLAAAAIVLVVLGLR